jgi:hypothetical protein
MISFMRKLYLLVLGYYIIYSYVSKNHSMNNIENIYLEQKNKIRVIIYNLQRLPYLLKDINIDKLIDNYDLVILQEYFNDFMLNRNSYLNEKKVSYNIGGKDILSSKIIDSGLVNISRFNLEFIDFINFESNKSVDKFANKGFLVSKLCIDKNRHLYIINTHLQNFYTHQEYKCKIISEQLDIINKYVYNLLLKNNYVLLLGDFNRNINDITWTIKPDKIIFTKYPTVWDNRDGLFPISTPYQVDKSQHPYWSDGGFLWGKDMNISNISNIIIDKDTDHCGVEFVLNI